MPTKKTSRLDVRKKGKAPVREPLTRERIARTALGMIDEEGMDAFSIRKLGAELGCEAMSIYHYLPGKAQLLDAVAELLLLESHVPPKETGDWIGRLREAAWAYRRVALAHPRSFILVAMRRFNTPAMLSTLDALLGIYRDAGFDEGMSTRLFRILGNYLNGAALAAITIRGESPDPPGELILENLPDPRLYPNVAGAVPFLGPAWLDATFEYGLEMLLDTFKSAPKTLGPKRRPAASAATPATRSRRR